MPFTTRAELATAVAAWLTRNDLSTPQVDDFIDLAEKRIMRGLRLRSQEVLSEGNVTVGGTAAYSLPTGFLESRQLHIVSNPTWALEPTTPTLLYESRFGYESGQPKAFAIIGSQIVFGPIPDGVYTYTHVYFKALDLNDSVHAVFTDNPDLYLYGALLEAVPFIGDDQRVPLWRQFYGTAWNDAKKSDASSRYHGGDLHPRVR